MGYTINRVSLFALIFSIGILVDDAIVVVENIARHWAMRDGRAALQATIEAVAEVGNPTVVATLTVVAALLPMLFVSGLMGPYMAPIPANASAAMLFSFFVAMVVAPWLMLRLAPAGRGDRPRERASRRRAARPALPPRRHAVVLRQAPAPGYSCSASASRRCVDDAVCTKAVTVKLLPFDNKSEIAVVVDPARGRSLEDTERVLFAAADIARGLPEITSVQAYAGTPAPFNFNGLVRHYYLRETPELGELQVNLAARRRRASARATPSRSICAQRLAGAAVARGHQHQGGRGAARAAGAGDAAGRNLRARCRDAPRGGRASSRRSSARCRSSSMSTIDRRAAAAAAAVDRPGPARILRRRADAMSTTRSRRCSAACGRLFASRRGPQSDRDRGQPAEARSGLERGAGLDAGARQHAARQQDGGRTRRGRARRRWSRARR